MKNILLAFFVLTGLSSFGQDGINWMTIEEAEAAMKEEPRKVVIDVYTDWCGWCKRMDKTTFKNEVIADYINDNYYAVKLDGEHKDTINFKGHQFKYVKQGRKGYNELAASLLNGRLSYPSIVYLDEDLNIITLLPGYVNAKQFEQVIKYVAGEVYKTELSFEDYKKEFVSEIN